MDIFGYAYHLSDEQMKKCEDFNCVPPTDLACATIAAKNTKDADLFNPISPTTGWRGSDIDVINTTKDPRLANTLLGRMTKPSEPNPLGRNDTELIQNCISKDFDYSDVQSFINSTQRNISDYKSALSHAKAAKAAESNSVEPNLSV